MKIRFYGLGSNLKEILYDEFIKNEEICYVFENSATYYEIKKEYFKNNNNLFYNFVLLRETDFYEGLLETNKIVIREEKQAVLFYNALTEKIRKELKIENYYDIIDLAYNFYNLFSELQEYKINVNHIRIEEWQKEIFGNLLEVNKLIEKEVQKKGIILPYMLRKVENISQTFLKKYKKICFVNKVNFTPFEKDTLELIEKKKIRVENILQIDEDDFDKQKLEIRSTFGLPGKDFFRKKGINIEIHQFNNKFTQLIGMVKRLEKESEKEHSKYKIYDIQDIDSRTGKDYQLLNQNRIVYNLEETMQNTKIYKVLNIICNILGNAEIKNITDNRKKLIFKVKDLYSGFKFEEFLDIFNLKRVYPKFQSIVNNNYKYISRDMLEKLDEDNPNPGQHLGEQEDMNSGLALFLDELEKIYRIDNMTDYGKYLSELFERQKGMIEGDIRSKYFEALSEMTVLEDFSFDGLWKDFFKENVSANLLKMFLKYLDKKAVSLNMEQMDGHEENRYIINAFSAISDIQKENVMFLNFQETFPRIGINNYLFSKVQRMDMGLPVNENRRQIDIFKFLNNIFGARNVYLSYVKNNDENIDCAGIIEEIKLKYGISHENDNIQGEIDEEEELTFIKKYFTPEGQKWKKKNIGTFIQSKLLKDKNKIKEEKLGLGYYSFENLKNFEYGYYLEKMIGDTEVEEIDDKIDPLLFGNIIHLVYEKIVKNNKEAIENKEYPADRKEIGNILSDILTAFEYKIPKEFIKFYREISFDEIVKSIKRFFDAMKNGAIEELDEIEKFEIHSEERIRQKLERGIGNGIYSNVLINGVIDLYIKAGLKEILIDYKSGNLEGEKLVKAQEQLDFYSIILGNENLERRIKYVIDTWSGEIKKDSRGTGSNKKVPLSEDKIDEVIKNYFEREFYGLGERNNTFNHKLYKDIARRDEEDAEDRK